MQDLEVVFTFNISTNRGGVHSKSTHWLINSRKPTTAEDINSLTHKLKNSSTQKLTNSQTHQLKNSPTQKLTSSPTRNLINSKTHQLKNSLTHKLTNSQAHQLTILQTHQLTNSSSQNLKPLSFILQHCSKFRSVLAKIQVKK